MLKNKIEEFVKTAPSGSVAHVGKTGLNYATAFGGKLIGEVDADDPDATGKILRLKGDKPITITRGDEVITLYADYLFA